MNDNIFRNILCFKSNWIYVDQILGQKIKDQTTTTIDEEQPIIISFVCMWILNYHYCNYCLLNKLLYSMDVKQCKQNNGSKDIIIGNLYDPSKTTDLFYMSSAGDIPASYHEYLYWILINYNVDINS